MPEESLPLSAELRLDAACTSFEAAWKAAPVGDEPRIEDYLAQADEADRWPLLRELLKLEREYLPAGRPSSEEYGRRFPAYAHLLGPLLDQLAPAPAGTDVAGPGAQDTPRPTPPFPPEWAAAPSGPDGLPRVAGYEVLSEVGRGGMGVVYKARQISLNRAVALKMLLPGGGDEPAQLDRLRREAAAVARLRHPNIVQIYEIGEVSGRPFLALEFVDGGGLDRRVAGVPQPAREAAGLVALLTRAVQAAHQAGVIHRDLKPANVLLCADGTPKVADFGLAKQAEDAGQTRSGAVVGTPSYMAPEQAAGHAREVGPAADVYALGAILYELLTGRPPFRGETVLDTLEQVCRQEPVPVRQLQPKVPRDLETICLKCLEKQGPRRYASAAALADDLSRFLDQRPIAARPAGAWRHAWSWARRHPGRAVLVALGPLTVAASVAIVVILAIGAARVRREKDRAEIEYRRAHQAVEDYFIAVSEDEDLKAAGLEPLRRRLLESARAFYEKFIEERSDDPALRTDLALAYTRLGVITQAIGSKDKALGYFRQAGPMLEQLVKERPDDDGLKRELARNDYNLGFLGRETGDLNGAEPLLLKAADRQGSVARDDPGNFQCRQDLGLTHSELGNVYLARGNSNAAEKAYRRAEQTYSDLVKDDPDVPAHQSALAAALYNQAELYRIASQPKEAWDAAVEALAIQQKLADRQPNNTKYQRDLALTHLVRGSLALDWPDDRFRMAEQEYLKAAEVVGELHRRHAQVTAWQLDLSLAYHNLALIYTNTSRLPQARDLLEKAIRIRKHLVEQDNTPEWQRLLATSYQNLGNVYWFGQDRERLKKAEEHYRQALEIVEALAEKYPSVPQYKIDVGNDAGNLGQVAAAQKDYEKAIALHDRAIKALAPVVEQQPRNAAALSALKNSRYGRAGSLAASGDFERAMAEARRLTAEDTSLDDDYNLACVCSLASGAAAAATRLSPDDRSRLAEEYGLEAVTLLKRVEAAGYFRTAANRQQFKADTDLDPLRRRPDFQSLASRLPE